MLNSLIVAITEKRPSLYIGVPGFVVFVIGVFFGILLLQLYNQTRYFSLAYAMRVAIFMILGAIGLFIYGVDVECNRAVAGERREMKRWIILGTRPEIIKMSPVIRECERLGLDYFILHMGQHYTYNRDKVFFEQLEILIDMALSQNKDDSFQPYV